MTASPSTAPAGMRPRLLVPGLIPYDPARESYRVRPGAVTVVALEPDDRLTVCDLDGGQRAELTVLAPDGGEDYAALALGRPDAPATVLRALVERATSGATTALSALGKLDPTSATATQLFGATSPAGAEATFAAERPAVVVVGAPAGGLAIEGGVPGSELLLEITRARPPREELGPELPEPLADPRLDFEVGEGVSARLRGEGGRDDPGHRRPRPPVLRLPRIRRTTRFRRARSAGST